MLFVRILAGAVLLAHGLVHLLYLAPDVEEFSFKSWLWPESARRAIALMLMGATALAFGVLAMAVWGVPGLQVAWPALAIIAAAVSTVLLTTFWDRRLMLGVALNAALMVAAATRPEWLQDFLN
jgi:hypothetical protein